ncbi:MAG: methyl-accepting chemotaxis protein [Sporomusaceae bacterium]|nr:methyl-accepting chemotaxis protein [Sporomusaceae bacterium]
MQFFRDLKIGQKISFLISIAVVFVFLVGLTGYYYLSQSNRAIDSMYKEQLLAIDWLNTGRTAAKQIESDLFALMVTTDDAENKRLKSDIDAQVKGFNETLANYEKLPLDQKEKAALQDVKQSLQNYRDGRGPVIDLAMQNKNQEAYVLYTGKVQIHAHAFSEKLEELAHYTEKKAAEAAERNSQQEKTATFLMVALNILSFILIVAVGWLIRSLIVKPLQQVVTVVEAVAKGDLSVSDLAIQSRDESGQVAVAVNVMLKNLRELIRMASHSAQQVAASSEELTAGAQQSADVVTQVAGSTSETAAAAQQQADKVEETLRLIVETGEMRKAVGEKAVTITKVSEETAAASEEGNRLVETAVDQMGRIESSVNHSAGVVEKLGERSQEIGNIVDTIAGIAGQTNLLALNAAIEAARAGEQGKGFAVVAEEVRKLAEQSQEAAKQIADLIRSVQADTQQAVIVMKEGTQEAKQGSEVIKQTGSAFENISTLVRQVVTLNQESIQMRQEMGKGTVKIDQYVHDVEKMSRNIMEQAQMISASTEEQSASMEEIAASSQSLALLAQELQETIQKFHL